MKNKWIKCSDKLPKDGIEVNTLNTDRVVDAGWHYKGSWDTYIYTKTAITHWMYLPKPPNDK